MPRPGAAEPIAHWNQVVERHLMAKPPSTPGDPAHEIIQSLQEQVREAARRKTSLKIRGAGSKGFLGRRSAGRTLDVSVLTGVIDYQPTELVITARAGERISDLEGLLAANGQMLAFEPPDFGKGGTVGGMVASGLAGPRRPFAGAVRDAVLGVTLIDGRGDILRFGGTVFKNVAGFDAFRLMAGAMGTLGTLLDVSLRVAPRPRAERSLAFEEPWEASQPRLTGLMRRPLPLSGAFHDGKVLRLRLSGTERAVEHAAGEIGGDDGDIEVWTELRYHRLPIFTAQRLWRLSVPRTAELPDLAGSQLIDWAGAQRWLATNVPVSEVREAARAVGGHAMLFHGAVDNEEVYERPPEALLQLHRRVKAALDPAGVFNRGRLWESF
jgi:glycolate oxidase FAD binding subunit